MNTSSINLNLQPHWKLNSKEYTHNQDNKNFCHKSETHAKDDILINTPLRYIAYTNEVGECLRPISSGLSNASWIPALLYIGADIWDKYKRGEDDTYTEPSLKRGMKEAAFQTLASVLLPTFAVVKPAQAISEKLANKMPALKSTIKTTIQKSKIADTIISKLGGYKNVGKSVAGLISLAVTIKPIDHITDKFIEKAFKNKQEKAKAN